MWQGECDTERFKSWIYQQMNHDNRGIATIRWSPEASRLELLVPYLVWKDV